jgi:hypothetical protein
MSIVAEPSDASVATEINKVEVSPSNQSMAAESLHEVEEARNDEPTTTDEQNDKTEEGTDDISITINGTTIVVVPEDSLQNLSRWVDDVNKYWDLSEGDTESNKKKSVRQKLTGSLTLMVNGVRNKTVKISHDVAEWIVSSWKGQSEDVKEIRDEPDTLKQRFNDFLESLKFAIPDKKDASSVFNMGAFNDDDSAMKANADIEVMLAESAETEPGAHHEC